jgi:hypothetical protein
LHGPNGGADEGRHVFNTFESLCFKGVSFTEHVAGCRLTIYRQMLLSLLRVVKKLAGNDPWPNHENQERAMTKPNDLYATAHLFVAAIRILDHQDGAPPSLESVCRMLKYSEEKGSYLLNRLQELGIVDTVKSGFSDRIVVGNHPAIEELPRDTEGSRLEQELKRFKQDKNAMQEKVASIKAKQNQKKLDLFSEIEKKLKQKMDKK